MLVPGLVFLGTGIFIWAVGAILGFSGIPAGLLAFPFGLVFAGLGAAFLVHERRKAGRTRHILSEGRPYIGRIVGYRDGEGPIVNGVRPLDVVVEFEYDGNVRELSVPTGGYDEGAYPMGAGVRFRLLGIDARIESVGNG